MAEGEGASTGRALYRAALAGGARALGRRIGAIAPGFRADFVALDADHPGFAAAARELWLDIYLFAAGRTAVRHVVVGGRRVVTAGVHRDRAAITARYVAALHRING